MWNIHSLLNQKPSGESILGYDKICWMSGFIHSLKNAFKVKIKYQKKQLQSCFIVLTMQYLEHMLHSDCGSTVCDGFCVASLFLSLKLVKQLWLQNSFRVSFPAGDRMMSWGRKIILTEEKKNSIANESSNSPLNEYIQFLRTSINIHKQSNLNHR